MLPASATSLVRKSSKAQPQSVVAQCVPTCSPNSSMLSMPAASQGPATCCSSTSAKASRQGSRVSHFIRPASEWADGMAISSAAVPQPFETMGGDTGVVGRVPGLAVAEIVLDQAQIVATIGEIVATGVAQRVRVDVAETSTPGGGDDEIVHRLTGQGLASLGQEQPGQAIRAGGKMTPDGTELVPRDRLLDRKAALEPAYPQAGGGEVEVRPAQADGPASAQPVTVHHEQEQRVARAMPALPGAAQQPVDLALAQEIFGTEAAVDCLPVPAFDNLPLGHPFATGSKGSIGLAPPRGAFDRRGFL